MVDYVRTRVVKEAVEARLLGYPGVHAVAIGPKITGGQRTGEPSILVFLVRKRPLLELAPEEVLPPEINRVKRTSSRWACRTWQRLTERRTVRCWAGSPCSRKAGLTGHARLLRHDAGHAAEGGGHHLRARRRSAAGGTYEQCQGQPSA